MLNIKFLRSLETVKQRTFVYISIALMILFCLFAVLINSLYRNNVRNVVQSEMQKNLDQMVVYLDLFKKNIDNSMYIFITNEDIQKKIQLINTSDAIDPSHTYTYYWSIREISDYIHNIYSSIEEIDKIQIYIHNREKIISTDDKKFFDANESDQLIYNEFANYNTTFLYDFSKEGLKIIRPLYSFGDGELHGFIEMMLSMNTLRKFMHSLDVTRNLITDKEFNVIADWYNDPVEGMINYKENSDINQKYVVGQKNNTEDIRVDSTALSGELYLISILDESKITFDSSKLLEYMLMLFLANLLILAVVMYFMSRGIFKRLKNLNRAMKKFQEGDFTVSIRDDYNDDLTYVFNGFNDMVRKIEKLIKELYEERLLQQDAEIKLLYAQINPHFIYNIFDNMNWLLQLKYYDKLESLIEAVFEYYKSVLAKGKNFILLNDLIEQLSRYVDIQSHRFPNRFTCVFDIDDDLKYVEVMNYILQPVLENSIYHGIEPKKEPCNILVKAIKTDNIIIFQVMDDGVGIDKKRMKEVRALLSHSSVVQEDSYFALGNINKRIKLYYGKDYGLTITNRESGGTIVEIKIPLIDERRLEEYV